MGYLNNNVIEIDAVLTNKGRQLLAKGTNEFKITQFALSDDEIDYRLWNPNHTLGSSYYGELIENMPIVEANTNEAYMMRFKLLTLPKNTQRLPVLSIGQNSVTLYSGQIHIITPTVINYSNANATYGYTAILTNSDTCILRPLAGYEVNNATPVIDYSQLSADSVAVVAKRFEIIARSNVLQDSTASIIITGNETGGQQILTVTVRQDITIYNSTIIS